MARESQPFFGRAPDCRGRFRSVGWSIRPADPGSTTGTSAELRRTAAEPRVLLRIPDELDGAALQGTEQPYSHFD